MEIDSFMPDIFIFRERVTHIYQLGGWFGSRRIPTPTRNQTLVVPPIVKLLLWLLDKPLKCNEITMHNGNWIHNGLSPRNVEMTTNEIERDVFYLTIHLEGQMKAMRLLS
jgi:hypothetical protein